MDSPDERTIRLSEDITVQPFDSTVQQCLNFAREFALIQGHTVVRSVHLVVGLLSQRTELTMAALAECELSSDRLCLALLRMIRPAELPDKASLSTVWSSTTRRILDRSIGLTQGDGVVSVTERHLWRAILMETRGVVFQALDELGVVEAIASRLEGV